MSGSSSSPLDAKPGLLDEPLGLTVHSLPLPQEAAAEDGRRTATGRLKMLLVLAVCAAPVVASYVTYYVIRPQSHKSYGALIDPQRTIPQAQATALDGKPVQLSTLRGQWLLVSVAGGSCDAACEKHLYLQRQLRESLGKDKARVDWVWLVDDAATVRPQLLPALAQATVLRVDAKPLAQWLEAAPGQSLHDHLYVVDPQGNWMMRFPPATDAAAAKSIKRDLERLLRASASWDLPGR
ncbi:SCO family protein [Ramlibacter sp. PS4R-6]|uniref:SCO family protein n=1 Tax=Ramlibacter sp. PS4R-6 TaxID=3133438 RepID=UPI0030B6A859